MSVPVHCERCTYRCLPLGQKDPTRVPLLSSQCLNVEDLQRTTDSKILLTNVWDCTELQLFLEMKRMKRVHSF